MDHTDINTSMTTSELGAEAAEHILEHFGVKGMRWGVRKSEGGGGASKQRGKIRRAATKANVALDAGAKIIREGEKKLIFLPEKNRADAASKTQTRMLGAAAKVNRSAEFKGKDIKNNPELKRQYFDRLTEEAKTIYAEELNISRTEAWGEFLGVDTRSATNQMRINAAVDKIRHAEEDTETLLVMNFITDDLGHVVDISVPDEYLKHELFVDNEYTLVHYGVKGMKWGVRRAEKHRETAARSQRIADGTATRKDKIDQAVLGKGLGGAGGALTLHPKIAQRLANKYNKKADKLEAKAEAKARKQEAIEAHKKWKEEAGGTEMANKVFQKAAKDFEKTAEIINNDPNYKGKDVTKGLLAKQYQATMNHYFNEHMAQASVDLTLNDQGRAYIYQFDSRSGLMRGVEHKIASVEHAESKFEMPDYKVELDEQGHMLSFSVVGELYHYGVKGMRWGYTTKSDGTVSVNQSKVKKALRNTKDVTVTQRKAGTYVKAKGGQRTQASTDAVKTQAARQLAKKSTTDALSNKQLKDTIERMRLEQEFAKLDKKVSRKGQGFVSRLFQTPEVRDASVNLLKKVGSAAS